MKRVYATLAVLAFHGLVSVTVSGCAIQQPAGPAAVSPTFPFRAVAMVVSSGSSGNSTAWILSEDGRVKVCFANYLSGGQPPNCVPAPAVNN
jgi:hypothetical protein